MRTTSTIRSLLTAMLVALLLAAGATLPAHAADGLCNRVIPGVPTEFLGPCCSEALDCDLNGNGDTFDDVSPGVFIPGFPVCLSCSLLASVCSPGDCVFPGTSCTAVNTCCPEPPCPDAFQLQSVLCKISDVVAMTTDAATRDKWEDAFAKLEAAINKLCNEDNLGAMGDIEGTVGDLVAAVDDGLEPVLAQQCIDELVTDARRLAEDVVKAACALCGSNEFKEVCDALEKMAEGDDERLFGNDKAAVGKYKDAKSKAETVNTCVPDFCTFSCP